MFTSPKTCQTIRPVRKLAHGLAALVGAAVLAGTVAVSAQTGSSGQSDTGPAIQAAEVALARPLGISPDRPQPTRKVRTIQIYNISADQKKFGG